MTENVTKLRAWWSQRQGLGPAAQPAAPAAVLSATGWARSVGGCSPYLTFFSRAGLSREAIDRAVANLEIHELPSARGCTYIVPAEDFALALHLAQNSGAGEMKVAEKLGVTSKEIDTLCEAVLAALKKGPLDPDGIRQASGGAVRSLGPEGQKKGLSSTLPVALERLQNAGEIRRIPTNGRLDQQRYQYALWRPNPLHKPKIEAAEAQRQLAARFFRWIAPARLSEFQTFAGIGVKAAKAAVEPLDLEPLFEGSDLLLSAADLASYRDFKPPKDPYYHLLTKLDSLVILRDDLTILNPDGMDFPSPVILDRGRIVGFWEYDPDAEGIVFAVCRKADSLLKKAVAATEEYIREQLGDARTFSLDSPKSRVPRLEALRKHNANG